MPGPGEIRSFSVSNNRLRLSEAATLDIIYSKHLRDSLEITKQHRIHMPAEHARSLFKLSEALHQSEDTCEGEAEVLRDEAEIYLKRKDADAKGFGTEACYDTFIPIFWR